MNVSFSVASISVVVPFYNRSMYLLRLLNSISAQSHPVEKVFVVDNGSEDQEAEKAWAIIRNHQLSDRCCFISTLRVGNANYARNLGFALSHSEYVAYLDSDDWWGPSHLKRSVEVLKRSGKAGCYSGAVIHKVNGIALAKSVDIDKVGCPFRFLFSKNGGIAQSSSFVVSKVKVNGIVEWDENLKRSQDLDYFISIQLKTEGWVCQPSPDYHIDWNEGGAVGRIDFESIVFFYNKWSSKFPRVLEVFFVLKYISVFQERDMSGEVKNLVTRLSIRPCNRFLFGWPFLGLFRFFLKLRLKLKKSKRRWVAS